MLRAMVLIYWILVFGGLSAQNQAHEISYSGVYRGEPLFVQNPYSPQLKTYCIKEIIVNGRAVKINYNRSALMLDFENVTEFSPVSIHISYSDSLCIPSLVNPDAIRHHSVFGFKTVIISDSSIVWSVKGEHENGSYTVEKFNLGYWEPEQNVQAKGVFGGAQYTYFPVYEEGPNKYRVRYVENDEETVSQEVEHVFYADPITVQRNGNKLTLSRSSSYVINDADNFDVLSGVGKEIDISSLTHGEYYLILNEEQVELIRKNDPVKVIKKPEPRKSNN